MKNALLHEGHRERLKGRFLSEGLESFETHNILELLLFYSIPRKDTNEIAHELLDRFGSLAGVFDASFDELITVDGVKENTATFLKLIPQVAKKYMLSEHNDQELFDTADKIGRFFRDLYIGETKEVVYALFLNNRYEKLGVKKIFTGSVNSSHISTRSIVDEVVRLDASMVVLAHNHPNGRITPSSEDIDTTNTLLSTLRTLDICLLEHFLIANNEYVPIMFYTSSTNILQDQQEFLRKNTNPNFL
ncbi:MAG: hypothetical protein J6B60_01525 [Clostridia bacterium]|nr:hypothetical protein [Clostridia bacterium]